MTPQSHRLDERNHVEKPFLDQLAGLGWEILDLDKEQLPGHSHRENFAEVVMLPLLRERLQVINPWLENDQVDEIVKRLTASFPGTGPLENNRHVFDLLLENTSVSRNRQTGENSPTVRFIDFNDRDNNRFIAVCQLKVRVLGTEHHIIPDIVLFLNGLPVVVIECRSPRVKDAIPEAIDQLLRYSEQREAAVRYKPHIDTALAAAVAKLEQTNPQRLALERLKAMRTDVIISPKHNDLPHLKAYTDPSKHETSIKSFKLPFEGKDAGASGEVGILIVNNMLLTGFNAPLEQVMYLDRVVMAHNLLQAIHGRPGEPHRRRGQEQGVRGGLRRHRAPPQGFLCRGAGSHIRAVPRQLAEDPRGVGKATKAHFKREQRIHLWTASQEADAFLPHVPAGAVRRRFC